MSFTLEFLKKQSLSIDNLAIPKGWERKTLQTAGVSHTLISSTGSPEILRIPMQCRGSYQIHLGIYRIKNCYNAFQVKCTSEKYWRRVLPMALLSDPGGNLQNTDLGIYQIEEGDDFEIRTEFDRGAAIAYLHLEPKEKQPETWKKNNVGVVFDMAEILGCPRIDGPDDLRAIMEPYRNSDFSHIFWGNAAGSYNPLYFSKHLGFQGESELQLKNDDQFNHRTLAAQSMHMFKKHNLDPLELAIQHAHDMGIELWSNDRINKNHAFDYRDDTVGGRFLIQHKEKRVYEPDGSLHANHALSFAYPEVREMKINFLTEQAEMGVDGIFIDFLRFASVIGWEKKVRDDFKNIYAEDIIELKNNYPTKDWVHRWLAHQASYLTTFIKDLRLRLNQIGKEQNRHIPIGVQVQGNWHLNYGFTMAMMNALDVETWAKENYIDFVAPCHDDCLWQNINPFDRIKQQLEGSSCKIWGAIGNFARQLYPTPYEKSKGNSYSERRYVHPERIARLAYDYYNQGAEGVYIWEGEESANIFPRWNIIKKIGHKKELEQKFGIPLGSYDGREILDQI